MMNKKIENSIGIYYHDQKEPEIPSPQITPFQKPSPEIKTPCVEPGKVPLYPKPEISPTPGPQIEPTKKAE